MQFLCDRKMLYQKQVWIRVSQNVPEVIGWKDHRISLTNITQRDHHCTTSFCWSHLKGTSFQLLLLRSNPGYPFHVCEADIFSAQVGIKDCRSYGTRTSATKLKWSEGYAAHGNFSGNSSASASGSGTSKTLDALIGGPNNWGSDKCEWMQHYTLCKLSLFKLVEEMTHILQKRHQHLVVCCHR